MAAVRNRPKLGLGIAVFNKPSPYRGYEGDSSRVLPSVVYFGSRLRVLGPQVEWNLSQSSTTRLSLLGQYRFSAYDENDSSFLQGLGDREDTVMAGLKSKSRLGDHLDLELSVQIDILDRVGGAKADIAISRSWQINKTRLTPKLQLTYLDAELANHDYGVPSSQSSASRPAYDVAGSNNVEAGLNLAYSINRNWMIMGSLSSIWLDDNISDSPLVDESRTTRSFATAVYLF